MSLTPPVVAETPPELTEHLRIRGARVHNLQNLNLEIPRDQFVVITGPSGSGKSSLAFDTLYAEGQRQYIESLSVYARQFLDQMQRPDVDLIEGLQPTICIDQRAGQVGRRSTVATVTEIYDYLRLLMARLGHAHCYRCGREIRQQPIEQIQDRLLEFPEGTKVMIMAPLVRGRKGSHKDVIAKIRKAGFVRARVDGAVYDLDSVPELSPRKAHEIDAVVDRVIIRAGVRARVGESVRLAVQHGEGAAIACYQTPDMEPPGGGPAEWNNELFSTEYACPDCNISYSELEPRTFSFNRPYGACPVCEGLGAVEEFDPELVAPNLELSIAADAIEPWKGAGSATVKKPYEQSAAFLKAHAYSLDAAPQDGHVEVTATRDKQRVLVRVIDDGPGIPPEVKTRMFDLFFTTKPVGKGTGIGLDLVRRLLRHNNAHVEVDSIPGRTEFRVFLPSVDDGGGRP